MTWPEVVNKAIEAICITAMTGMAIFCLYKKL